MTEPSKTSSKISAFINNKRNLTIIGVVLVFIIMTTIGIALSGGSDNQSSGMVQVPDPIEQDAAIEQEPTVEEEVDEPDEPEVEPEQEVEEVIEPEPEPEEPAFINELNGLAIDESLVNRRPMAVTISNIQDALPQYGISQAEVLVETLAEGGIPRLVAVFKDFDSEKIGPIRSGRHYLLFIANDFGAIYVHYGESPQAKAAFTDYNAAHMDGMKSLQHYQAEDRVRPHASFTTDEMLYDSADNYGYRTTVDESADPKFLFSDEQVILDGSNANYIRLPFSWYKPYFEYNEATKLYERFQYGEPHMDAEVDVQLTFTNIIIQNTDMWLIPGDSYDRIDMSLFTTGTGYYLTGGQYVPITWQRDGYDDATRYFYEDGTEVALNRGKTYIAVFPSYNADTIIFEQHDQ